MSTRSAYSRRGFLIALGASSAGLGLGIQRAAQAREATSGSLQPNVFVKLDPSGVVTITCHRAEMGQGIRATLPWIIAAEMGASYDDVVIKQATGDKIYGNQNTDGSTSIRAQLPMLREVGAVAREMLAAAAAARWRVPAAGLVVEESSVTDPTSGTTLSFAALASEAAEQTIPRHPTLRARAAHLDKPLPFTDVQAYVDGSAQFGADVRLPGLRYAVVARPPDVYGSVDAFDDTETRKVPGVLDVIRLPVLKGAPRFQPLGGIAVVATNTWAAMQGRKALSISWLSGENAGTSSAEDMAKMHALVETKGKVKRAVGNVERALAESSEILSATYEVPHLAHAPMEPPVTVAWAREDRCEIWAPIQAPQQARSQVAKILGLETKDVTVNQTMLGGGFGRKSKPDFCSEAAFVSHAVGAPVLLQWDRTDDLRHGYFHASSVQNVEAGFDASGALTAWRHRVGSPPIISLFLPFAHRLSIFEMSQGLLDLALDVPNVSMEALPCPPRLRIGWMRSVYNINHGFAVQSFIDELAHHQGVSTPEMLKTVLGPPRILMRKETGAAIPNYGVSQKEHPVDVGRWHTVIDDVLERSGYGRHSNPDVGYGFAVHASFMSYVAAVVAVVKDNRGRPKIDEVWLSVDAGEIMNPDRACAQMEGAVLFGISVALHGQITYANGAVLQSNYHDYRVARMPDAPREIHVTFIDSGALPGGIGEPGVPPIAPAIASGWFALTGERVRTLPMIT